jgi:hypothetical protein
VPETSPRSCPFPLRPTWAVYQAGSMWRVLAPARALAVHEADAWVGDFATHAEALTWVTDPAAREAWLERPEVRSFDASDRILFVEGMLTHCSTLRHLLFDGQKAAA